MHFGESHVRANKLDVQETDLSFTQFWEAEVISLDAGLRMDGIPALDLWDLVIEVFHSSPAKPAKPIGKHSTKHAENKFQPRTPISICPILITFHQTEHMLVPMLCCMSHEDNEAVSKMIITRPCVKNPQSCFGLVI